MKKVAKVYRQGDCNLIPCETDLSQAELVNTGKSTVLAYGEVTFHKHQTLASHAKQYRLGSNEYLVVNKDCQIKHEEHAPLNLPKGTYQKIIAREYDKVGGERRVVD